MINTTNTTTMMSLVVILTPNPHSNPSQFYQKTSPSVSILGALDQCADKPLAALQVGGCGVTTGGSNYLSKNDLHYLENVNGADCFVMAVFMFLAHCWLFTILKK